MVTRSLSLVTAALTHRWSEQARLRADREQETRVTRDQKREACHNYLRRYQPFLPGSRPEFIYEPAVMSNSISVNM